MKNTMTTAEKARKDFNEKGILPAHLKALAVKMEKMGFSKSYEIKDVTPEGYGN